MELFGTIWSSLELFEAIKSYLNLIGPIWTYFSTFPTFPTGSRTLPLENGCVSPDTRTSHQTLRTENEGVIILLESRLFGLGYAWLHMVPAGAGVTQVLLQGWTVLLPRV